MADTIKASKDSFDELQFLREISLTLACSEDSQLLLNNLQAVFEKYLSVSNFRIFIKDESSNTLKDFVKNWITVGKNPQQELVENIFQRLKNINDTGFVLNNKLIKYTDKKDKLFSRSYQQTVQKASSAEGKMLCHESLRRRGTLEGEPQGFVQ